MEHLGPVAIRYAQAFSQVVRDEAELRSARDELRALGRLVEQSSELKTALSNPVVSAESKQRVVQAIAERQQLGQRTQRLLKVLGENDRLSLIDEVGRAVDQIYRERAQVKRVEIRTAAALEPELRQRLTQALERLAGGRVEVVETIDPQLLGGLVASIGTKVYDASLKTKLERIRSRMVSESAALVG